MSGTSPTDASGNGAELDHWRGQNVETVDGIGSVVEDHGDQIKVTHEFPTHGTEHGVYAKSDVNIVEDISQHPANTSLRSHSYEELTVMEEPKLNYYD